MARVAHFDGQYLLDRSAASHIEDRRYQFAVDLFGGREQGPGPLSRRLWEHHLAQVAAA